MIPPACGTCDQQHVNLFSRACLVFTFKVALQICLLTCTSNKMNSDIWITAELSVVKLYYLFRIYENIYSLVLCVYAKYADVLSHVSFIIGNRAFLKHITAVRSSQDEQTNKYLCSYEDGGFLWSCVNHLGKSVFWETFKIGHFIIAKLTLPGQFV